MNGQQLKNSILQMAVQGKLVPQDPNDEPASVLLERIRKEKEQLIKEGKIKKEKNPSRIFRGADNLPYEQIGENEPVCIANEVPFEIPNSWEWVRLNFVCQLTDGIKIENRCLHNLDAKYLRRKSEGKTIEFGKYVEKGTYLILVDGENSGEVFIAPENGYMGSTFKALWMTSNIYREYLLQFLDFHRTELKNSKKGAAIPHLNKNLFFNLLLPVPPYYEQKRILEKLKELHPLVDKYRKNDEKIKKVIDDFPDLLKKSILQQAVMGKLVPQDENDEPASVLLDRIRAEKQRLIAEGKIKKDKNESIIFRRDNSHYEKLNGIERCIDDEIPFKIPDSWEWIRLGNIGDWGSGATPSRSNPEYYNGDIPWLKTGDLNDGYIEYIPEKISLIAFEKTSVRLNPTGSVLIAMYGATIGKVGILTFPSTTNQACCACFPIEIYNEYLFYFLMSQKTAFVKRGEGGAQPNISKEKIIATLMPLPPLAEQFRIAKTLNEVLNEIEKLKK